MVIDNVPDMDPKEPNDRKWKESTHDLEDGSTIGSYSSADSCFSEDSHDSFNLEFISPPSHTLKNCIRSYSWNPQKGLRHKLHEVLKYMANARVDIANFPEAVDPDVDFSTRELDRLQILAGNWGYELITSKHQWVLIKKHLASRQSVRPIIAVDGRIIATEFDINSETALLLIHNYGVARDENSDNTKSLNKCKTMRKIIKQMKKIKSNFFKRCKEFILLPLFGVQGDLQDTYTKGTHDNYGSYRREQHKLGILKWCLEQMQHVMYKL